MNFKIKENIRFAVQLILLTVPLSPQAFAGFSTAILNSGDVIELPTEIGSHIVSFLDFRSLMSFSLTSHENAALAEYSRKRLARQEIEKLIGQFVHLEKGAFIAPSGKTEMMDYEYWMPVDDVTQLQYDQVMGDGKAAEIMKRFSGAKKPMTNLIYAKWDHYIARLNQKLLVFWPIAYPETPILQAYRPEINELRYAMTDPIETVDENGIQVTGKLPLYSGTDSEDEDEVKKYVTFLNDPRQGPSDVDSVAPNQRGLRNLSGNVFKQTTAHQKWGGSVVLGNCYCGLMSFSKTSEETDTHPNQPGMDIGLRLVLRVSSNSIDF